MNSTPKAERPSIQQVGLWLEPDRYECDRIEWQSLWSIPELQEGSWEYLCTVEKSDGWYHRFHHQDQRLVLNIRAYDLWAWKRLSELDS